MATAAGAIVAKARREVREAFWDNDAFSPERAIAFEPRMSVQSRYLEQLIAEGVVHEEAPGRYWFDLPAYQTMQKQQFSWTIRILALAAVVFLLVLAIRALGYLL
jgi:hypothetical protein